MSRSLILLTLALLSAGVVLASSAFTATSKPKYGVFGSPANKNCLSVSSNFQKRCKGHVAVYDRYDSKTGGQIKGQTRVSLRAFRTGRKAIDEYSAGGYDLKITLGKVTFSSSNNYYISNQPAKLSTKLSATLDTKKKATVKYTVSASRSERKKTGCKSSAFKTKTTTVKWFASKNTGG